MRREYLNGADEARKGWTEMITTNAKNYQSPKAEADDLLAETMDTIYQLNSILNVASELHTCISVGSGMFKNDYEKYNSLTGLIDAAAFFSNRANEQIQALDLALSCASVPKQEAVQC